MNIQKNHVVTLHYSLNEDNLEGELIEETYGSEPMAFIFGVGMMLPAFESNIENMAAGDGFSFTLDPLDAYGEYQDEAVVEIPMSSFTDESGKSIARS